MLGKIGDVPVRAARSLVHRDAYSRFALNARPLPRPQDGFTHVMIEPESPLAVEVLSARTARLTRKRVMVSVWCLPEEKTALEAKSAAADLSLSRYLREVGLGHTIRGTLDSQAFLELAHARADLGRLGGLLKMWLGNDERLVQSHDPVQLQAMIERLVERLAGLSEEMHEAMQRL